MAAVADVAVARRDDIPRYQRPIPTSRVAAEVKNISGNRSMSGYPQLIARSLRPWISELWNRKYAPGTVTNSSSGGWITAVKMPDWRTASTASRQPST